MIRPQFVAEEVLYQADLVRQIVHRDRFVRRRRWEDEAGVGDWALVLGRVASMQTILQQVQRY